MRPHAGSVCDVDGQVKSTSNTKSRTRYRTPGHHRFQRFSQEECPDVTFWIYAFLRISADAIYVLGLKYAHAGS